jgi:uncharacterized membrane protein YheB (UPF0754 family)
MRAIASALSVIFAGVCVRTFSKQFIAAKAAAKFANAGGWRGIYATIPIISGLLNLCTNKLAVWMIFSPLEFVGNALLPRQEGQPGTLFGWQGIVPAKVKKMGGDIADLLLSQLLDIKEVFARLDSVRLAKLLTPRLVPTVSAITKQEFFGNATWDLGEGWNEIYDGVIKQKTESIMVRLISQIKEDPNRFIDMRQLLGELQQNKKLIVDLFQKCGREELKFIVNTGLWGGMALGVVQMAVWLVWDPWWSLAAGGALVGYVTDWLALKIMFEPVEPIFSIGKFKFQGLFLQRQKEVSEEFAEFMSSKLLRPSQLWQELATGARSDALVGAIAAELAKDPLWSIADWRDYMYTMASGGEAKGARVCRGYDSMAREIADALPAAAEDRATATYVEGALRMQETLRGAMLGLSSAEFEKVLHPIFQEDEGTLIAVGTVLGAASGLAQVPFY